MNGASRTLIGALCLVALSAGLAVADEPDPGPGLSRITLEEAEATPGAFDAWDPMEPMNRRIYRFNAGLDRWVLLPAVRGYRRVLPSLVRTGVRNFFENLGEITVFLNSVLQLRPTKAGRTFTRFVFNTTAGVGGLFDVASLHGFRGYRGTFGQTLGRYGIGPGPYFVVPALGPSTVRDAGGDAVDFAVGILVDPLPNNFVIIGLQVVDARANVPFRYGDLSSPFEYELVRFLIMERARLLTNEEFRKE